MSPDIAEGTGDDKAELVSAAAPIRSRRHGEPDQGEQQLGLFADRTSAHTLRANQLRLWLSSVAYMILNELRRVALAGTELAHAQVSTIRTRLLKIGAIVTTSVRRIYVSLSSVFPFQHGLAASARR